MALAITIPTVNIQIHCLFRVPRLIFIFCAGDNGGTTDNGIAYNISICPVGQTNFTGFRNHYRMPSSESGGVGNFWYSFNYGMTHFIQLNTETDLGRGFIGPDEPGQAEGMNSGPFGSYPNEQLDWLKRDLQQVDREKTPWVIAGKDFCLTLNQIIN